VSVKWGERKKRGEEGGGKRETEPSPPAVHFAGVLSGPEGKKKEKKKGKTAPICGCARPWPSTIEHHFAEDEKKGRGEEKVG